MRRALLLFSCEVDRKDLIESAVYLKEKFNFDILPLYVRDIRRDEIVPMSVEGMVLDPGNDLMTEQWKNFEDMELRKIRTALEKHGINSKLNVEIGLVPEIVRTYLKKCDLLIFGKGEIISENVITLLKDQYKPIIMVKDAPLSMEKVGIATDDGVKINKSLSNFLNLFPGIDKFLMLSWNYEPEENNLLDLLKYKEKEVTFMNFKDDSGKVEFYNKVRELDILIMGNLSRSYFFEMITRRKGLNILENAETTMFIG
ncbi:MAG: hypothetical protein MJH09_01975 [Cetobacterium sp.]|uniref:Universal stress protein family protein n=1 Tax=Cetobacterium ceti TaxID=180163 RepID=A0A1T4PKU8_9FUSO|nr:hypothetical protein [Cetobacterium ceti]MCJ8341610.1 hypothetical protein [Cetobacterium sp.]SJZ92112.1 hypothetical protein SAMN02745174_01942 [Cetobacterium ceti]